ncbi:MAG: hydrogenase maturation nickel metallochaperone HypA [Anaerolineaceae bacterium]|jgi:Zn finger protein HypA/HybF involved in hydrogenase expression|nr:MAG: hydrogenase maturation nickel metallochaperone HypA [Anaerolineaceae bacterium]
MSPHPRLSAIRNQLHQNPPARVVLALGELFPLDEKQLREQWRELVAGTPLADLALTVRILPAQQQCMVCFLKYHPQKKETACPQCGSVGAKILSGEELYLESF